MTQRDPFEDYRRRREIELMESRFKQKAAAQRKRLETLLSQEGAAPGELEEKVTREMEDFLFESTRTAERMIEHLEEGTAEEEKEEMRREIRTAFGGAEPDAGSECDAPGPEEPTAESKPGSPRPSIANRRPLGGKQSENSGPLDLKAALARIRKSGKTVDEPAPPDNDADLSPPDAPSDDPDLAKRDILDSFDQTFQQVSELILKRMEAEGSGDPENPFPDIPEDPAGDERETFVESDAVPPADAATLYREKIRRDAVDLGSDRAPAAGAAAGPGAAAEDGGESPAGSTNVFQAEPGEDRDIDDDLDTEEPPGWNIPVRPPPPGAWIVQKQKEEGDAGLSGAAGDTYLLKKLSQEVRQLNRVYLVLLEKKVVTRDEVEGDGAPAPAGDGAPAKKPKRAPKPKPKPKAKAKAPADDDEEDDDVVSVEDYDEERYRPILTSAKDFSLSALVKDVHRLKCLRDVLVKKGVVSEKELAKAK